MSKIRSSQVDDGNLAFDESEIISCFLSNKSPSNKTYFSTFVLLCNLFYRKAKVYLCIAM